MTAGHMTRSKPSRSGPDIRPSLYRASSADRASWASISVVLALRGNGSISNKATGVAGQ